MWLNRLEYKYGRYCIRNLPMVLVGGQLVMYFLCRLFPLLAFQLQLSRAALAQGQVWRLVTFLFVPPLDSPFSMVIRLFFFYSIATTLQNTWGPFKFNVFYFCGVACALAACLLGGVGTMAYMVYTMFIAFSIFYPDSTILLFYIVPVKAKYLGILAGLMLLEQLLFASWPMKLNILLACVNLLLFFGKGLPRRIKQQVEYARRRAAWRSANNRYR